MAYTSNIPFSALTGEERTLCDRVEDMLHSAMYRGIPKYTAFLDERQQAVAQQAAAGIQGGRYGLFGGYENAERRIFAALPDYLDPEDTAGYPIQAVTVTWPKQYPLTHRDLLGALMHLQIKRETVGDILVGPGLAVLFLRDPVGDVVQSELLLVGRVGVQCAFGLPEQLPAAHTLQPISGTVSSLRLDAVVSLLTKSSREQAARLVRTGAVAVNAIAWDSPSKQVEVGDKISVRGQGKFIFSELGGSTKKERIHITCHKYI